MNRVKQIFRLLMAVLVLLSISSCFPSLGNQGNSDLQAQVAALETQNAILLSQMEQESNSLVIPDAPDESQALEPVTTTPTEESLPTSPVPAGQPITYDGWAITVSKEIVIDYEAFGVKFIVRNLGESDRVFRYQLASVTLTDDLGNSYMPTDDSLCEEHMYITKNLSIDGDDSENIYTPSGFRNCHDDYGLTQFTGPIAIDAQQIFVHLENFGPLSGVSFVIDL